MLYVGFHKPIADISEDSFNYIPGTKGNNLYSIFRPSLLDRTEVRVKTRGPETTRKKVEGSYLSERANVEETAIR